MVGTLFNLIALAAVTKLVAAAPAPELVTVTVPQFFNAESTALQAAVVGVDSNGHTTYALKQDEMEGSSTAAFITGTLVAGGDPAVADYTLSFTSQGLTLVAGFDCNLQSGGAVCTGVDDSAKGPQTATLSVTQLVLDVPGPSASASATPASGSTSPANGSSSQPTGSAPAQPTESKPSSAQTLSASAFMLISPLLTYYLL
ncbi:hypothetical protein FB45DRAFT_1027212 [Roridomyces roridus]|uniref:Uncharacterized protein n=1 Tax=Roridomyces roridus TaxID=1738132 RepID=A0AAD7BYV3_9AGAR|nr:hypothetical protein FB45DRAFT_1027212 [Roridomyces roridus]